MGTVQIDPRSADRPVLPTAGEYGAGKNGFDVILSRFECPAEERACPWDREDEEGPYAYFGFMCKGQTPDGNKLVIFLDHWEKIAESTGSKALRWLRQVGVSVSEDGIFDPGDVTGREVIITVSDPRTGKDGSIRNGFLNNVHAA